LKAKIDDFIYELESINGSAFMINRNTLHSGGYRTIAGLSDYLENHKIFENKINNFT
jgi:hypothetical protein